MTIIDLIIWLLTWHTAHGGPQTDYEPVVTHEATVSAPAPQRQLFVDLGPEGFVYEDEDHRVAITPVCTHRRVLRRGECS